MQQKVHGASWLNLRSTPLCLRSPYPLAPARLHAHALKCRPSPAWTLRLEHNTRLGQKQAASLSCSPRRAISAPCYHRSRSNIVKIGIPTHFLLDTPSTGGGVIAQITSVDRVRDASTWWAPPRPPRPALAPPVAASGWAPVPFGRFLEDVPSPSAPLPEVVGKPCPTPFAFSACAPASLLATPAAGSAPWPLLAEPFPKASVDEVAASWLSQERPPEQR